jgi:cardiolipin synthase
MLDTFLIIVVTAVVTLALSILKRNLVTPELKLDYRLQELALSDPTFERCMAHLLGPPMVDGNQITSLLNGDEIFPAMLAASQRRAGRDR